MALSVGIIWGLASIAAAVIFAMGAIIVVLLVRHRHRQLRTPAECLTRGLSTYHRTHLSVEGSNYAHIAPPKTRLRRSNHTPYGVVSEGWEDLASQESIARPPTAMTHDQQGVEPELAQPKRLRSMRATFSPHSFHVPKSRRQKKIDKAIPLNAVGRSPLSAITEFSDPTTNTRDVSSAIGAVELPTETTPTTTPPRHREVLKGPRPLSSQWPLCNDKRKSQDIVPAAVGFGVEKRSATVRMNSIGHGVGPGRVSLGQRSLSTASIISVAPANPLPPLPTILTRQYSQRTNSKIRSSVASTDTVSSSVLGTGVFFASIEGTEETEFTIESPRVALSPSLLQVYESRPESWGSTAVAMGTPPGTKTSRGLRTGAAGIGSFRASIGNPLSRMTSIQQAPDITYNGNYMGNTGSVLKMVSASGEDLHPAARGKSVRKSLSPSLPAPVIRYGIPRQGGRPMMRHSMYEQHTSNGKNSLNYDVLQDVSGNEQSPAQRLSHARPASTGTSNPFTQDQEVLAALQHASFNTVSNAQYRSHKRQNCVDVPNLLSVQARRRSSKLAQATEEDEQLETPTKRSSNIPGLRLLPQDDEDPVYEPVPAEGPPAPSPFRNRPILNPTSRSGRAIYSRTGNRDSSGSLRPDSEVFSGSLYSSQPLNIFNNTSPDRQWPLSPTPLNSIKLNATPSSTLKTISEPYDPESPILPSPTLLSATLFPRKSTLHGPRTQPSGTFSGHSSRTASPSPLQRLSRNANTSKSATKQRSGDDLRRSVMMLRRMNSDMNNASQDRVSKIYRNIANEYAGSLVSVKTRSPSVADTSRSPSPMREDDGLAPLPLMTEKRLTSMSTLAVRAGGSVRYSNSRMGLEHSVSMVSNTGASIWEDASVRGDSPEPDLPLVEECDGDAPKATATGRASVDLEGYENFVGQNRARESKLTSPERKGLGLLGLDGKVWGTPGSLYDTAGFLKE